MNGDSLAVKYSTTFVLLVMWALASYVTLSYWSVKYFAQLVAHLNASGEPLAFDGWLLGILVQGLAIVCSFQLLLNWRRFEATVRFNAQYEVVHAWQRKAWRAAKRKALRPTLSLFCVFYMLAACGLDFIVNKSALVSSREVGKLQQDWLVPDDYAELGELRNTLERLNKEKIGYMDTRSQLLADIRVEKAALNALAVSRARTAQDAELAGQGDFADYGSTIFAFLAFVVGLMASAEFSRHIRVEPEIPVGIFPEFTEFEKPQLDREHIESDEPKVEGIIQAAPKAAPGNQVDSRRVIFAFLDAAKWNGRVPESPTGETLSAFAARYEISRQRAFTLKKAWLKLHGERVKAKNGTLEPPEKSEKKVA